VIILRMIWQSLLEDPEAVATLLKVPDLELKLRRLIYLRPVDATVILAR
jgi:hypothetical protein